MFITKKVKYTNLQLRRSFYVVSWRNMDPLVHTRDQGTVETVDFTGWTCSEEGEDCPIGRKGDGRRFFLDSQRVIYIDYLEKGKTVTGLYYAELLGRFAAELQKIRPHLAKKKCSSIMTTHRLTLPPSPRPNWSNWATNCYPIHHILQIWPRVTSFCFQTWKVTRWTEICVKWGCRRRHRALFSDLETTYFSDVFKKLEHRWVKCIELKGDYVEK